MYPGLDVQVGCRYLEVSECILVWMCKVVAAFKEVTECIVVWMCKMISKFKDVT